MTMEKKIYLSFPISGYDIEERREYAQRLKKSLEHFYDQVLNPLENGIDADAPVCEHMRQDFRMLLDCDAIFLGEGWQESMGCRSEFDVAVACRMDLIYEKK